MTNAADHHGNAAREDPQHGRILGIEPPKTKWKPSPFDSNHKTYSVAQRWEEHERPKRAVFASHRERMGEKKCCSHQRFFHDSGSRFRALLHR